MLKTSINEFYHSLEDSLLTEGSAIMHHGNVQTDDDLTPTLENWVVLTWLQLLHSSLPRLVKQKYGTELRIDWRKLHKKQHVSAFFGKSVLKCHLT